MRAVQASENRQEKRSASVLSTLKVGSLQLLKIWKIRGHKQREQRRSDWHRGVCWPRSK